MRFSTFYRVYQNQNNLIKFFTKIYGYSETLQNDFYIQRFYCICFDSPAKNTKSSIALKMDRVKKIFGVDSNDKNTGDNDSNQVPCNDKHSSNNRSSGAENEIPPEEIKDLQDLLDSGLFGNISSLFVNPTELQKQIESQLQEIMRQMEEGGINDEFPDGMQQQLMQDEELKGDEFKRILGQQSSKGPLISTSPSIRRSDAIGNKKNKPTDDAR